jgi:hypothetical protein
MKTYRINEESPLHSFFVYIGKSWVHIMKHGFTLFIQSKPEFRMGLQYLSGITCGIVKWEVESPKLYSFTTKNNITLNKAKSMEDFHHIFQLPLTNEAGQQYNILLSEIENLEICSETDTWTYIWGTS